MPRGPLWTLIGLFSAQQTTGRPSTSSGQPEQSRFVVQAAPGLLVKAPQTLAPKPPTAGARLRVDTGTSPGSGSGTRALSAATPAARLAVSSTSTAPLPWQATYSRPRASSSAISSGS